MTGVGRDILSGYPGEGRTTPGLRCQVGGERKVEGQQDVGT